MAHSRPTDASPPRRRAPRRTACAPSLSPSTRRSSLRLRGPKRGRFDRRGARGASYAGVGHQRSPALREPGDSVAVSRAVTADPDWRMRSLDDGGPGDLIESLELSPRKVHRVVAPSHAQEVQRFVERLVALVERHSEGSELFVHDQVTSGPRLQFRRAVTVVSWLEEAGGGRRYTSIRTSMAAQEVRSGARCPAIFTLTGGRSSPMPAGHQNPNSSCRASVLLVDEAG
jgi:hypothetical protein